MKAKNKSHLCPHCHESSAKVFNVKGMLISTSSTNCQYQYTEAYFVQYLCLNCNKANPDDTKYVVRARCLNPNK